MTDTLLQSLKTLFILFRLSLFVIVSQIAPECYIDEEFHVSQTQAYCGGRFSEWNDKITTPPGLYLVSWTIFKVGKLSGLPFDFCSITVLRLLNLFLICGVLPVVIRTLYRQLHNDATKDALVLVGLIPALPLLSFFGNLYYTDVLSTTAVLSCYLLAIRKQYVSSAMIGALSVLTRQTNIIWVVFIMAISVIRVLKELDVVKPERSEMGLNARSWIMFDPTAADARFPADYITAIHRCVLACWAHFSTCLLILSCYLPIFVAFILFLLWNGGIVLGDKANHIAGIHIPQMFYCAVFIAGFAAPLLVSWSVMLVFLRSCFSSVRSISKVVICIALLLLIVHLNTVEHPFLRSDNRHFIFYIWRRTIKRNLLAKYLAVPFYYAAGWIVLTTLSYSQSALFVLGFVTCTALTIVPSPLLEFRYFVLPYLFWRLHISPSIMKNAKWRGILEFAWYEMINIVTIWIFVNKPFTWVSEPGKIQRFMW